MTKNAPLVSVIIPTFNRARELERCLSSVLAQTYPHFDIWVCDDGSTDNTAEVVARFKERASITYRNSINYGGPAWGRNWALKNSEATYLAFLDSDDFWLPEKLALSVDELECGADFVYHPLKIVRHGFKLFSRRILKARKLINPISSDLLEGGNTIPNSSVVLRRELLLSIEGFEESQEFIAWEDYDAWLRLSKVTDKFSFIPQALGSYWVGSDNLTNSTTKSIERLYSFQRRYLTNTPPALMPAWFNYELGRGYLVLGNRQQGRQSLGWAMQKGLSPLTFLNAAKLWLSA
jgi:glycosyltransferase involved in cell wall biosynthesis